MGLISALKQLGALEKLYREDLAKQDARTKLLSKGLTEEWVRELMRQADTGVVAELSFPSGQSLKITRTITGLENNMSNGPTYKEEF